MLLHIKFIGSILCLIGVVSISSAFVQPIAPETNRCNETEYFNPVTKNCTKFSGGGRAMFIDQSIRCSDNYRGVKPYLDTDKLYVICETDLVVLATCPDNLRFDHKTLQCEANKKLPCDLANMPICTKTGRFALDRNSSCFYTCDAVNEKLIPTLYQCPGTSLYSSKLQRCSYSCKTPPTQIFDKFDMDPEKKGFFPPCFKPGQFRTPTDCSRYYKCSAKTNGRFYQTRLMCPDATIYDINTESCRPRAEVTCEMMSIVELLNLYEFYKHRKQQCKLNYTDDVSIENCMKACTETEEIPITTISPLETIMSTLSSTEIISTTTKPIETTEMGVTSRLSETTEDSEEEDSIELLDESTSLRPRKKHKTTTTTESSHMTENTTTIGLESLSSTIVTLETSTQSQTEQSSSTIQNSEIELNDTDSITDEPTVDSIENITNYSNVSSTMEVSSAQEIVKTTTESTIIHETSVDSNLPTTTAIFVPSNNDTNADDISRISKSSTDSPIESTSMPELVSTPEATTAIINTTTTSESTESISSSDDQNVQNSTDINSDLSVTMQNPQTDGERQFSSTIFDDDTTKSTTIQNDSSTDAVTSSIILPSQIDSVEESNLESESLIGSIFNETEPTSDNSTTEATNESTETMINTTENEGTSERATTVGEIKSTEPTTIVDSTPEDAISQTITPDFTINTTENIDSSPLNATEIDQNTTESTLNTSDTTLSPSSPVNDENSSIKNTMPLEMTTIQVDENRSTDSISSIISDEDESLGQEKTESIANSTDLTEELFNSTTSINEEQYSTEANSLDETTADFTNSSIPANTDIPTTVGLESDSLVSSDENIPTTSSSNTAEPMNTTTSENETESTTTEQIQQTSSSLIENSTLFLLDESATIRPENGTSTENISSSTEFSQISPNDGDSILGDLFNPENENGLTTSESSVSDTKPVLTPEMTTPVALNSTTETAEISSSDENKTPRHEDESSIDPSEIDTSSTESSILSNQTQAPDNKQQSENESLTSPNLEENQEQENDSTTQESFSSNVTTSSDQETTTVAPVSGITDDLLPTFRNSTENEQNSSLLPSSTESEPNNKPQTDLVVESLLGDNTENSFISNSTENISNDAETTNPSPIWNTTTISDQEPTTLVAATSTMDEVVESMEMTTAQTLPNTTATTSTQSNIETSTQDENSTFEMSTEMEGMINTTTIEDESTTVETASEVMQSNSTSNEEATQTEIEPILSLENEENTPTTPSLLELLTSTWWPSSTENENETTEELNNSSTESTSTESISIIGTTPNINTTDIQNTTDSTISSYNATEAVHNSNNVAFNNTLIDFEIEDVPSGPPKLNFHVKRNMVINLNFTGDCC